jgi:hypothetical protein
MKPDFVYTGAILIDGSYVTSRSAVYLSLLKLTSH